jgi:DNA modification methylase
MNTNINIVYVPLSKLIPSTYNPRTWDMNDKKQLKESVTKFGMVDPIVVNGATSRKNIVIGGHFRLEVLRELGYTEAPVVYVDISEVGKEKELNIRLNKNQGSWDAELLLEFDPHVLEDIGFSDAELEELFVTDLDTDDDGFDVKKELATIITPHSKIGDRYKLGNHYLSCGDSTDQEVVKQLVGDVKINMTYCDPVYNINLSYKTGIGGTKNYGGSSQDNRSDGDYMRFIQKTVENAISVSDEDAHIFYYCDQSYVPLIATLYTTLGIDFRRTCIWLKGIANPTPQIAFSKVYESCVYGTIGSPYLSPYHRNYDEVLNKEVGTGNQMVEDVEEMFDVWLEKRLPGAEYEHPTEKPVTLHDKPIKRCTKIGDNILSLFGGSGGELIACEQLKRVCYMVELDPVFVDFIIRRYEKATGNKAIKIYEKSA